MTLLALGGASAGALALWPERPSAEPERPAEALVPSEVDEPVATTPVAEQTEAEPAQTAQANTEPAPTPTPATPPKAQLTVAVFPWGEVWINGKARGAAPLKNHKLKAGVYKISAGQGRPSKTQTVRLRPGQKRTVVFDLTASEN